MGWLFVVATVPLGILGDILSNPEAAVVAFVAGAALVAYLLL